MRESYGFNTVNKCKIKGITLTGLFCFLSQKDVPIRLLWSTNTQFSVYTTIKSLIFFPCILKLSQAGLEVIAETEAQLWWAAKELKRTNKLSDYVGKNEKTKIIVKIQKVSTIKVLKEYCKALHMIQHQLSTFLMMRSCSNLECVSG